MKTLFLILCLTIPAWAQSRVQDGRIFNVRSYGCVGDGTTDDAACIKKAVTAWNANSGGGTLYFPTGTYKRLLVDPSTDTNDYSSGTSSWIIDIGADNQSIVLAPDARIKIVANYIHQTSSGSSAGGNIALLGTTAIRSKFEWHGGKVTWEVGSATLTTVVNGTNESYFFQVQLRDSLFEDITIDGFPRGGLLTGYTDSYSMTRNDSVFRRINVTNYGGSGHDNWWYFQGGNLVEECRFVSTRTYQSHAIYWGSDRPNNTIRKCYFSGICLDTGLSSKYPLHIYATSGGEIRDFVVEDCTFENNMYGILMLKDDGSTLVTNGKIINNTFRGPTDLTLSSLAMYAARLNNCIIQGNRFESWKDTIQMVGSTSKGNKFINNYVTNVGFAFLFTGTDSICEGNYFTAPGVGNRYGIQHITQADGWTFSRNIFYNWTHATAPYALTVQGNRMLVEGNDIFSNNGLNYVYAFYVDGNENRIINNRINVDGTAPIETLGQSNYIAGNVVNKAWTISPTGGINTVVNNRFTAIPVFGGAGKSYVSGNEFTAGVSTLTSFYNGVNNAIGSTPKLDWIDDTYAASYTPHAGAYRYIAITLTGNITINAPTNPVVGRQLTFVLTQDGTGGRTTTFDSVFKTSSAWSPSTTASKINAITFIYNGTNWREVSVSLGQS